MDGQKRARCDICGGRGILIHSGTRDDPKADVYECEKCRTKFLGQIRDKDYENGFMNGKNEMSPEEITERLDLCRPDDLRRAGMVAEWCRDKDVLDFGCGFGGFLKEIARTAKTAAGVELSSFERKYLNDCGLCVKKKITDYSTPFDVITLFHVFEHLSEPRKWLLLFAEFLRGGGRLFIEVPNANDALLALYGSQPFSDFTYWSAHLYLYTKESLTRLIEECGLYEIESAGQVQRYPLANHFYWLARGKPGGHEVWDFLSTEPLNRAYEEVLAERNYCDTLFYRLRRK